MSKKGKKEPSTVHRGQNFESVLLLFVYWLIRIQSVDIDRLGCFDFCGIYHVCINLCCANILMS